MIPHVGDVGWRYAYPTYGFGIVEWPDAVVVRPIESKL